jgi:hypothetical protein
LFSITPYITKEVTFKFRGRVYEFALSHGLFSSADIDRGSRFLLRVFSKILDEGFFSATAAETLSVLDAGCGCGVLGICAGLALTDLARGGSGGGPGVKVRAQDRDELARLFTGYNGRRNGFASPALEAYTEVLLAGPAGWDLILSNIPAKAGRPVLEDFIARSARMLRDGGLVLVVVVNPLALLFRDSITARGFSLLREEAGGDHTVFAYRGGASAAASGTAAGGTVTDAYGRGSGDFEIEGICYHIDAIHGAAGFDRPGAAVQAAAKLVKRLGGKVPACIASNAAILVHEPDQGHFPAWFARCFPPDTECRFVLSGRNILALEAARRNLERATEGKAAAIGTELAVDIALSREELVRAGGGGGYGMAVLFPDLVPGTDRIAAYWEGLAALLAENGIAVIALDASAAGKFDRQKSPGFTRLGDFRREGFRALAYVKQGTGN